MKVINKKRNMTEISLIAQRRFPGRFVCTITATQTDGIEAQISTLQRYLFEILNGKLIDPNSLKKVIADTEKQMRKAAADLNFEAAAELRDRLLELKRYLAS